MSEDIVMDEELREIGGYIELDTFSGSIFHDDALTLNYGRACLSYVILAKKIKKILLPYFLCSSIKEHCEREGVRVRFYHIGSDFVPIVNEIEDDEWLYVVNFYGQIRNEYLYQLKKQYKQLIIDNTQAFFQKPLDSTDCLYTCRKYFGVSDGAFLYTDSLLQQEYDFDCSYDRVGYLLGRYERTANEFYRDYVRNDHSFTGQPIRKMSKLTQNLLRGIDYERVKQSRTENFAFLHQNLKNRNQLSLKPVEGAFMYPLMINNAPMVKKLLASKKIYIPTLWPNVIEECPEDWVEWKLARDVLPLPVDQRYTIEDMCYLIEAVLKCID